MGTVARSRTFVDTHTGTFHSYTSCSETPSLFGCWCSWLGSLAYMFVPHKYWPAPSCNPRESNASVSIPFDSELLSAHAPAFALALVRSPPDLKGLVSRALHTVPHILQSAILALPLLTPNDASNVGVQGRPGRRTRTAFVDWRGPVWRPRNGTISIYQAQGPVCMPPGLAG